MTTELLEAKALWKTYGKGEQKIDALKGVSLTIQSGEIIAVMGPSGCGKTTLLNVLSGIDNRSKGTILLNDRDPVHLEEQERDKFRAKHMGFVFQSYNLIPVLSAVENVELPLVSQGQGTIVARQRAEKALARVGLHARIHHSPSALSGGQQQRVALARAIVNQPQLVWADEPTGALDRKTTEMVLDLIEDLNRSEGVTFVIVTHNRAVAERADRVLYMDSGEIIQEEQRSARNLDRGGEVC